MKTMTKKLGAIILALAMCFSLTCVAFADEGDYTITVENSIGGSTYSAYKVFDATYSGDAVSYTIDSSSAWYSAVSESSLFTLDQSGASTTYYVKLAEDASEENVISFLNTTYEIISGSLTASATETGTGSAIILDVGAPGYYYVTTSQGATASITTAAPTATIVDKNQVPGSDLHKDADSESHSIGDEVTYTIKSYVPTYSGTELVDHYTVTDTMGSGLTYDYDIKVELTGTGIDGTEDITNFCTININDGVLTVTWYPADIEAATDYTYPADASIIITYTDTINDEANDGNLSNVVELTPFNSAGDPIPDPNPEPVEADIYVYGFDLKKTDSSDEVLTGAEFTLQKEGSSDLIEFLYDADSDTYEEWDKTTKGETTTTITVSDGEVNIWGLGVGTYILTETVAPDGYNLLDNPVTIIIAETTDTEGNVTGWTVTVSTDSSNPVSVSGTITVETDPATGDRTTTVTMPAITIVNNAGSTLPGTGGIGTTIFYIIGGVLVAGAVVVLITRRRMSSAD